MVNNTQELMDNIMINYVINLEECDSDYNIDEMFPGHEYGCIDIIN